VTDGDNNPWPQRWIEKRWRIGAADRARWGARRREEALAALQVLGVDAADVRSFGLPDLGLTELLMNGKGGLETRLAEQIEQFRPTCVFLPALDDRHPDHSALHIGVQLALQRLHAAAPQMFAFGVHGDTASRDVVLTLDDAQLATKRTAIMMHVTQMRLSRRRFVAYAQPQERFRRVPVPARPQPNHPLRARIGADGRVEVGIDHATWRDRLDRYSLFALLRSPDGEYLRRTIELTEAGAGSVIDSTTGAAAGAAMLQRTPALTTVTLSLGKPAADGWVKLARRVPGLFVLDRHGWQTVEPHSR
jgi:LmbE family N-acetylglucosaminyl deacetylase